MIFLKRPARFLIVAVFFSCCRLLVFGQAQQAPFYSYPGSLWADSILSKISLDEKIGQLFMVAAWSDRDTAHTNRIREEITKNHVGGLIFFQGGPVRQAILTNEYQQLSNVPLFIGMDAEWGLAMRIDSTIRFPRQMTLSAAGLNAYIYNMGTAIAHQCQRLGVHINFAPVADINNNPLNPIIGSRAFGDDTASVTGRSLLYMKALQVHNILACAKHFPGHGDTDTDSHLSLPVIHKDNSQLDSLELVPFKKLISEGVASIMVAHLFMPAIDSTENIASTLSNKIVTGMLKDRLKFNGLVFTDALNMKGVSSYHLPGELEVKALLAGNDVLLYPENVPAAIEAIKKAIEEKRISEEQITKSVKKILIAKYWAGLNNHQRVDTNNLYRDLNTPAETLLSRKIYESAVTILKNKKDILPLEQLDTLSIAAMMMGDSINNTFDAQLKLYAPINTYTAASTANKEYFDFLLESFEPYDVVIIGLHKVLMNAAKSYGITDEEADFISTLAKRKKVILTVFGNPYSLTRLKNVESLSALLLAYEDMPVMHELAAQAIFGGLAPEGKLPVHVNAQFPKGEHAHTFLKPIRLRYSLPEEAGMQSEKLSTIDSIVTAAIKAKAFPGCRVLAARNGIVFYNKSFGYLTYDSLERVNNSTIYDVASVTKIAATGLAVMSLYESKKIDLDKPLSTYLPSLKNTDKKNMIVRDVLAHQAGLRAWEPFWKKTMRDTIPDSTVYHASRSGKYWVPVAQNFFMRNTYRDSVSKWLIASPLGDSGKYVYSDFGPILMKQAAERLTRTRFDSLLHKKFYKPLGLASTAFLPLERLDTFLIAPTENDTAFRKQLIRGYVHDQAAAMQGGISGNAGLFSTATDLAIIMQMLLNKGEYGGEKFFEKETVEEFTKQQFPMNNNRRGLLFDKPEPDTTKASPVCKSASLSSFGHSGFTGTYVWADPENNLIFIFLSNRVHPDTANDKLVKMNVRTKIHQVLYDAVKK